MALDAKANTPRDTRPLIFGGDGNNNFLLNKGSIVSGEVFGGNGDDSYTIDRLNVEIREFAAGGSDTFRSLHRPGGFCQRGERVPARQ